MDIYTFTIRLNLTKKIDLKVYKRLMAIDSGSRNKVLKQCLLSGLEDPAVVKSSKSRAKSKGTKIALAPVDHGASPVHK